MAYIGNFLITKLSGDITSSATTMMVTSGDGVKFGAEMIRLYGTELFPYYLVIHSADYQQATLDPNREIVKVTGRDEDTFTIVRGQRGTTAKPHSVNDIVQLSIQADDVIVPLSGLINPDFISPLYVSANSFTVAGDVTSWLRPGRGLVITFQTSGIKRCVATSLSYNSGTDKTTINTIGDSLVNETITGVLLSLSDGENILKWVDTTGKNSGYLKIGEIMIAWGKGDFRGSGAGGRTAAVSFPVNFSTTPAVSITVNWADVSSKHGIHENSLSTSGFTAYSYCDAAGAGVYFFYWIAIGKWM